MPIQVTKRGYQALESTTTDHAKLKTILKYLKRLLGVTSKILTAINAIVIGYSVFNLERASTPFKIKFKPVVESLIQQVEDLMPEFNSTFHDLQDNYHHMDEIKSSLTTALRGSKGTLSELKETLKHPESPSFMGNLQTLVSQLAGNLNGQEEVLSELGQTIEDGHHAMENLADHKDELVELKNIGEKVKEAFPMLKWAYDTLKTRQKLASPLGFAIVGVHATKVLTEDTYYAFLLKQRVQEKRTMIAEGEIDMVDLTSFQPTWRNFSHAPAYLLTVMILTNVMWYLMDFAVSKDGYTDDIANEASDVYTTTIFPLIATIAILIQNKLPFLPERPEQQLERFIAAEKDHDLNKKDDDKPHGPRKK